MHATPLTTSPAATPAPAATPRADAGLQTPAGPPAAGVIERPLRLQAIDGRALAATWHEPAAGARAVAVLSSATGVPRGFYAAFAGWLAQRGYAVLSYDYRGVAGSRQGPLRQERASMRDWAVLDMRAALAEAERRRVGPALAEAERRRVGASGTALPLLLVGHSFGGNAIAFAEGVQRADALLMVAAQLGEARLFPGHHRWVAEFFFRGLIPALAPLYGGLPGRVLGPGAAALPARVAQQWARWGRTRGWAYADPQMRPFRAASALAVPVHLWDIDDDLRFAPPRAVDALAALFRNAAVQRHTLRVAEVGAGPLGHFGAFRRRAGPAVWQRLLAPIEAASPALRAAALG